jgi:hypothetical protein
LASVVALAVAVLGLGLAATPAGALNHETYNILRNAGSHQYCLDIKTEDAPLHARAQLWTCTHPVVGEQLLILVSDGSGGDYIKVRRSGYCLDAFQGIVTQEPCDGFVLQSWELRDTGEIVNSGTGRCLDAAPADTKRADVIVARCDGGISQRWFF